VLGESGRGAAAGIEEKKKVEENKKCTSSFSPRCRAALAATGPACASSNLPPTTQWFPLSHTTGALNEGPQPAERNGDKGTQIQGAVGPSPKMVASVAAPRAGGITLVRTISTPRYLEERQTGLEASTVRVCGMRGVGGGGGAAPAAAGARRSPTGRSPFFFFFFFVAWRLHAAGGVVPTVA